MNFKEILGKLGSLNPFKIQEPVDIRCFCPGVQQARAVRILDRIKEQQKFGK